MDNKVLKKTLQNKVSLVIIILFMLLLIGCGIMSMHIYQGTSKSQKYFIEEPISILGDDISNQKETNQRLTKVVNDSKNTLTNAYIELDPYKANPLSGIIIFQTKNEEQIRVYINNKYETTMEATKKHIIPIYGLLSDYENTVRIESPSESKDYVFKTEKVDVDYVCGQKEKIYFNEGDHITGCDSESKLRLYFNKEYSNTFKWLSNGHILTAVPEGKKDNKYVGLIEVDFLGKIYNKYILKNGVITYDVLSNGNIIALGTEDNKYVIYTIDPRTGEVLSDLNVYSLIKDIDNNIGDEYITLSNKYYELLYKDNKVFLSGDNITWCIDFNNKKLLSVQSKALNNTVWASYMNNGYIEDFEYNDLYYNKDFYDEVTNNINLNSLNVFNNKSLNNLSETTYRKIDLDNSTDYNHSLYFTNNLLLTDYDLNNKNVKIYLVNRAGKIYILDYKNDIYNIQLPTGQYVLFINIDDTLYKTNKVYQF